MGPSSCGKGTHHILCLIYALNIVEHVPLIYPFFYVVKCLVV